MTKGALEKDARCPVDRYAELDEEVRDWLERATPEKLAAIDRAIKFVESAETIGKFGKWAIITLVGTAIGAASFGEAIFKIINLFRAKIP